MSTARTCRGGAALFLGALLAPVAAGGAPQAPDGARPADAGAVLERWDRNKDGSLDRSEVPDGIARRFEQIDLDRDGKLDARELQQARRPGRRRPGGLATRPTTRPGDRPGEVITPAAQGERHPDTLKVGDLAPDFTLPDPTGKKQVTLSGFRGKPVVLIFASYT